MREPLFRIMYRLRKMKLEDQCAYLIACIKCEADDSQRQRELKRALVDARTRQIRHELRSSKLAPAGD